MDQLIRAVANNVRALGSARGMSLNELAAASGTGKGTLSRIESAQANPTVETLYALADALGVPFGSLVTETSRPEHVRAADRPGVGGTVAAKLLTQAANASLVEALEITFPEGQTRRSKAHPQGVIEHLLHTDGRLRAGPTNHQVELDTGDVLRFPGDVPHEYAAIDGAARAIVLMAY